MLKVDLFENLSVSEIPELLKCFGIKTKTFKPGSFVLKKDDKIDFLGIIIDGKARISNDSGYDEDLCTNDIFGHNIVCTGLKKSPVNIYSENGCEVLFLPFEKLVTPCEKLCPGHLKVIRNIMKMISKRNSILTDKIDIIGRKTIREKVSAFLKTYDNGGVFSVPYSREQTANFLCTDRSALSRELCKMRDERLIKFYKNNFQILKEL